MLKATFTIESLRDLLGLSHHELTITKIKQMPSGNVEFEFEQSPQNDVISELTFDFTQTAIISAVRNK